MRPYVGIARVIGPGISARRHSKLAAPLRNVALGMTEPEAQNRRHVSVERRRWCPSVRHDRQHQKSNAARAMASQIPATTRG
jgi:hypothetical protein